MASRNFRSMLRSGYHDLFKMLRRSRVAILAYLLALPAFVSAQSNWKEEWDKAIRSAESEEQLTLYGCCYEYDRIVEGFKKEISQDQSRHGARLGQSTRDENTRRAARRKIS